MLYLSFTCFQTDACASQITIFTTGGGLCRFCLEAARIIKNWKLLVAVLKDKFPQVIIYFSHTYVDSG